MRPTYAMSDGESAPCTMSCEQMRVYVVWVHADNNQFVRVCRIHMYAYIYIYVTIIIIIYI